MESHLLLHLKLCLGTQRFFNFLFFFVIRFLVSLVLVGGFNQQSQAVEAEGRSEACLKVLGETGNKLVLRIRVPVVNPKTLALLPRIT